MRGRVRAELTAVFSRELKPHPREGDKRGISSDQVSTDLSRQSYPTLSSNTTAFRKHHSKGADQARGGGSRFHGSTATPSPSPNLQRGSLRVKRQHFHENSKPIKPRLGEQGAAGKPKETSSGGSPSCQSRAYF